MESNNWYKKNDGDKVWWLYNDNEVVGEFIFSFDKIKEYNLFADFPHNMKPEEVKIFVSENPYWAGFFADRLEEYHGK